MSATSVLPPTAPSQTVRLEGDEGGQVGTGGGGSSGGEDGGWSSKQISQPELATNASDVQSMRPSAGTTPAGPLPPQYLTLLIVR